MTPTESPLLNTVAVGETFSAFCCIRYLEMRLTQDNRRYLLVELGDRSGRIRGRLWKDADRLRQQYSPGQLVRVKGMVRIYHGRRDLRIMAIRPLNEKDDVSLSDMLPRSEQDGEQFMERFLQHCRSIGHPELRKLVELLIGDPLLLERLGESPAGKLWHHNYLGGLLEHLVMALELAVLVQRHYAQLDSDLLRSAIILHGLGHLSAYRLAGYIEFSDEGRLLGRQQLACQWTADLIGELPSFPADLRLKLMHMLASQPGDDGREPTILPMTLEAVAMTEMLRLSERVNGVARVYKKDALPDSNWSSFNPLMERYFYTECHSRRYLQQNQAEHKATQVLKVQ